MNNNTLRIGTRKSRLAMVQTEIVREVILAHFPFLEIEIVPMSTKGDKILDRSLTSFGGKGVFTKELEDALLKGEIDLAVHSAKDMPMEFPKGLTLGAVLSREDASDVMVTTDGTPVRDMIPGSVIGTSSLRRQIQIRQMNPQVKVKLLRGNVQTRLEKLKSGQYDGILLAAAGLNRLGIGGENLASGAGSERSGKLCMAEAQTESADPLYFEHLPMQQFVPAAGQGILAVEIRQGELGKIMKAIHSVETEAELTAEREFLTILGGGCNAPCGAHCRLDEAENKLSMQVMYAGDGVHPEYRSEAVLLDGSLKDLPEQQRKWEQAQTADTGAACAESTESVRMTLLTGAKKLARDLAVLVRCKPVYLVGAGPGDTRLFTEKGLDCVRRADVIVYDNLISGSILNEARLDAELIYAGKRSGSHHMKQEEISALLVKKALEGHSVVRLKGGDPFIFGRGGEEALELSKMDIPFEIVPGVSSSYSVPAYAGIPVTHRGMASSFHVITGHEDGNKTSSALDYQTLAKEEGTLVFLMGLKNLDKIADNLIANGKDPKTPAAVLERGTTAAQRSVKADLAHIAEAAEKAGLRTPAISVIGPVVELKDTLFWFGRGVLSGKRIMVTGTRAFVREMEEAFHPLGAELVALSLIEVRPLWNERIAETLKQLGSYQWIVFTSGNGVELFFALLREQGIDLRRLIQVKFAVIGRKTAEVLLRHGFRSDFVPEQFSGADLAAEWIPTLKPDEKVALFRAENGSRVLTEALAEAGISYDDIGLYETWTDLRRQEELNRVISEVDYVTVASSSAAQALAAMLEPEQRKKLTAKLISIGPSTTKAMEKLGLPVYSDAVEYTAEGIASVIRADVEEML